MEREKGREGREKLERSHAQFKDWKKMLSKYCNNFEKNWKKFRTDESRFERFWKKFKIFQQSDSTAEKERADAENQVL